MPFVGVLPERRHLFRPEPRATVGVNDAHAWRLNPAHRQVYDKLQVALSQGLVAAPCGVSPIDLGIEESATVFVKPITNLAGMALNARPVVAGSVHNEPGSFWCELLTGPHTSTDCLVRAGEPIWFAHTLAADEKDHQRPLYWQIGAELPWLEPAMAAWIAEHLAGYTGLCNLEMIGGRVIEAHLRGSNGFFDFYGPAFVPAWVALVDGLPLSFPGRIPGGYVLSLFSDRTLDRTLALESVARPPEGVSIQLDRHTPGRAAIVRANDLDAGLEALAVLRASLA